MLALAIYLLAVVHTAMWQYDTNGAESPAEHVALIGASFLWPASIVFGAVHFIRRQWRQRRSI